MDEIVPPDYIINTSQFESIFVNRENYSRLRNIALDGHLGTIHNRFLSWKLFLGVLPEHASPAEWMRLSLELRERYKVIQQSHVSLSTKDLDPVVFNPLSPASDNPWNNFYVNNDLKETIKKDVDRTFQERPLFELDWVKLIMTNILFTWAKENPALSYKQGMNELLGTILFVAYAERAPEAPAVSAQAAELLAVLNAPSGIEADTFWLFSRVMDLGIKELFNPIMNPRGPARRGEDLFEWDAVRNKNELVNEDKSNAEEASYILKRCHRIHHRLLSTVDNDLYKYLEQQQIEPQMYLQRWLRCVLTREFNFAETLLLWDAMFAHWKTSEQELSLLDYICVAMMEFVRLTLLESDHTGVLRRLLKFPPVEDVSVLISMAVKYKDRVCGTKTVIPRTEITVPQPATVNVLPVQPTPLIEETKEPVKAPRPIQRTNNAPIDQLSLSIALIEETLEAKAYNELKLLRALDGLKTLKNELAKDLARKATTDPLTR